MLYVFDWDGTLCDSLSLITQSIQISSNRLGLPERSEAEKRAVIGLGLYEAMSTLYPELSGKELSDLLKAYRQAYIATEQKNPGELYAGVREVLEELLVRGHTLAVATGKSRRGLDRVLASTRTLHYFAHSRCADETRSKPHPMMLREILQEAGAEPKEANMVGDTEFDVVMARSASVAAVGVNYGAHSLERIQAARPERIIQHISELL